MPKFFDQVVNEIVAAHVVAEIVGTWVVAKTYQVVYPINNTEFMNIMLLRHVLRCACVIT